MRPPSPQPAFHLEAVLRPRPGFRHVLRALAALLLLMILLMSASGCGLFYRSSRGGQSYVLYSDRSDAFLENTRRQVDEIYDAYLDLFELEPEDLGVTLIFLEGHDRRVVDHSYSPSLLGYYVPLFNLIRIDTEPPWAQTPEALKQVLLHEISHHFVVTKFPAVNRECWLNEGLAGNLEVSLIEDGHAEFPLMHPALVNIAGRALRSRRFARLSPLLNMGWGEFHDSDHKVKHYALAWSIVYYLLEHELPAELPLAERIERLHGMDGAAIAAVEDRWLRFFREFDLTDYFIRKARASSPRTRLTSEWAVRQLGKLPSLDDERTLPVIVELFDSEDETKRRLAWASFVGMLVRNPHLFHSSPDATVAGLDRIREVIHDDAQDGALREVLIEGLGNALPARSRWVGVLVPLLECDDADVRAASARALSSMAAKPTIVNPAFWRYAPASARAREVGEWRDWLEAHDG